jgi:hypothetical protein
MYKQFVCLLHKQLPSHSSLLITIMALVVDGHPPYEDQYQFTAIVRQAMCLQLYIEIVAANWSRIYTRTQTRSEYRTSPIRACGLAPKRT